MTRQLTVTPGEWSAAKCPTRTITIAPTDHGSLHLVRFLDETAGFYGEIAICQGKHARSNAHLMSSAKELLTACLAWEAAGIQAEREDRQAARKGEPVGGEASKKLEMMTQRARDLTELALKKMRGEAARS